MFFFLIWGWDVFVCVVLLVFLLLFNVIGSGLVIIVFGVDVFCVLVFIKKMFKSIFEMIGIVFGKKNMFVFDFIFLLFCWEYSCFGCWYVNYFCIVIFEVINDINCVYDECKFEDEYWDMMCEIRKFWVKYNYKVKSNCVDDF